MRRLSALAAFCLALAAGSAQAAAAPAPLTASQVERIRAVLADSLKETKAPGLSVAVGLGDQIVWSGGAGLADVENQVPAGAHTAYRTASIVKPMTATAAMRLAEQGKLDLDAPIQTYCPRYPAKSAPITVRDLVTHTSGIRHYEGPTAEAEAYITRHYDHVSDAIDAIKDDPLVAPPSTDFHYTTWGYVVLGCVLEGATGEDYIQVLQRLIFTPSHLTATRGDDPRAVIPHRARGYVHEGGVLKNSRWSDVSAKMAGGGLISTAPDLVRFMQAWMRGALVGPKTQGLMLTSYRMRNGKTVDIFGQGWFIGERNGHRMATYGGGAAQVSGMAMMVPDQKLAVAALYNLEGVSNADRMKLVLAIADIVSPPPVVLIPTTSTPAARP